jgi:osmoprotectant transport system ATP-binding protein
MDPCFSPPGISLEAVSKVYPGGHVALRELTLHVEPGEVLVLVGTSGSGKTTTMKMVNRLVEPTFGVVRVGGRDVREVDAIELRRSIGYVIQDIGLFPHMTVARNIAVVPSLKGWSKARQSERVTELLGMVGLLPGEHMGKYPHQLSGGQKQRVGVARALAGDPGILLMDEPFGALDPITRGQLHDEFAKLQRRLKKTVVFVTHDMLEAIRLADRMAILDDGRLLQVGTAREILTCPESSKVADLVGADATLRLLGLSAVAHAMETSVAEPEPLGGSPVRATDSLKDALVAMVAAGRPVLSVVDDNGVVRGRVTLSGMHAAIRSDEGRRRDARTSPRAAKRMEP